MHSQHFLVTGSSPSYWVHPGGWELLAAFPVLQNPVWGLVSLPWAPSGWPDMVICRNWTFSEKPKPLQAASDIFYFVQLQSRPSSHRHSPSLLFLHSQAFPPQTEFLLSSVWQELFQSYSPSSSSKANPPNFGSLCNRSALRGLRNTSTPA